MTSKRGRKILSCRRGEGFTLVELIVSLGLGAILCFTLASVLSQSLRQSSDTQNQFYANSICSNLTEHVQSLGYNSVKSLGLGAGPQLLLTNRPNTGGLGPTIRREPVLLDLQKFVYSQTALAKQFNGDIYLDVQSGFAPDTLNVVARVDWIDSTNSKSSAGQKHSVVRNVLLHQFGSRFW